jgi:hypothetical protein
MSTNHSAARQGKFDILTGLAIALVTVTAALVLWQASRFDSNASELDRQGMIETIKREAAAAETVRFLYQEASYGVLYDVARTRTIRALQRVETSRQQHDEAGMKEASSLGQWLGQAASSLAGFSPLSANDSYRLEAGRFDLDKRFQALQNQNVDLRDLDPFARFARADQLHAKAKRLTGTIVVFACALLFFTMAQIIDNRLRYLFALGGVGFYSLGVLLVAIIDVL